MKTKNRDKVAQRRDKLSQRPIYQGEVAMALVADLQMLMRELAERRQLADELSAWFAKEPALSEQFGAFQAERRAATPTRKR